MILTWLTRLVLFATAVVLFLAIWLMRGDYEDE